MDDTLRDTLAVEVSELFDQVEVVQRDGSLLAGGDGVVLAGNRSASERGCSAVGDGALAAADDVVNGGSAVGCRLVGHALLLFYEVWARSVCTAGAGPLGYSSTRLKSAL